MQLREGTGEGVFFNESRLIAANRPRTNQSCFLIDSFVKCSRAHAVWIEMSIFLGR